MKKKKKIIAALILIIISVLVLIAGYFITSITNYDRPFQNKINEFYDSFQNKDLLIATANKKINFFGEYAGGGSIERVFYVIHNNNNEYEVDFFKFSITKQYPYGINVNQNDLKPIVSMSYVICEKNCNKYIDLLINNYLLGTSIKPEDLVKQQKKLTDYPESVKSNLVMENTDYEVLKTFGSYFTYQASNGFNLVRIKKDNFNDIKKIYIESYIITSGSKIYSSDSELVQIDIDSFTKQTLYKYSEQDIKQNINPNYSADELGYPSIGLFGNNIIITFNLHSVLAFNLNTMQISIITKITPETNAFIQTRINENNLYIFTPQKLAIFDQMLTKVKTIDISNYTNGQIMPYIVPPQIKSNGEIKLIFYRDDFSLSINVTREAIIKSNHI